MISFRLVPFAKRNRPIISECSLSPTVDRWLWANGLGLGCDPWVKRCNVGPLMHPSNQGQNFNVVRSIHFSCEDEVHTSNKPRDTLKPLSWGVAPYKVKRRQPRQTRSTTNCKMVRNGTTDVRDREKPVLNDVDKACMESKGSYEGNRRLFT